MVKELISCNNNSGVADRPDRNTISWLLVLALENVLRWLLYSNRLVS